VNRVKHVFARPAIIPTLGEGSAELSQLPLHQIIMNASLIKSSNLTPPMDANPNQRLLIAPTTNNSPIIVRVQLNQAK
jgi:hypothetical protein